MFLRRDTKKKKTTFDADYHIWKYATRGKTIRDKDIRIVVAFDEDEMLVITVIHVGRS
jgi:hypothetical protein